MKLISFANQNHGGLINLKNSLVNKKWEHCVLGKGMKWEGWLTRTNAYITFLNTLDPEEIVVLCDAFDVLCLRSSDGFLESFQSLMRPIVIGTETCCLGNCIPPTQWWLKEYGEIHQDTDYKYSNGGLIAGKAEALIKMYQWGIDQKIDDDQMAIGSYINEFPSKIWLDHKQILFFNDVRGHTKYEFNKRNYSIKLNDKLIKPFLIHFPGVALGGSLPLSGFLNPKRMFKMGINYITIGNTINGKQQINALPITTDVFTYALWGERSFYILLILLILIAIFFFLFCQKKNLIKQNK